VTHLDDLISQWGDVWPSEVAEVYAFAGQADDAFAWIERDHTITSAGWAESVLSPVYNRIRNEVRWQRFINDLDLAPSRMAEIQFELPGY